VDWNAADWMAISTGQLSLSLSYSFSALDIDNSLIFWLLSEHSICYAQHFVTVAVALFGSVTHHLSHTEVTLVRVGSLVDVVVALSTGS